MAHFYSLIKGHRGQASRLGTKASGMDATAASWQGAVSVRLWHDESTGLDMANVELVPWHGSGVRRSIYYGPVSGETCECSDSGCPAHKGQAECSEPVESVLYRIDMQDETGVRFCSKCAEDAMDAGVFSTRE